MPKCYLSITITLVVTTIVTSRQFDCRSLQWVPGYRRKVFTAIINNINCPTWTTRNTFTKEPTKFTKLRLPEGLPFAFNCGACFTPSSLQANLTARMNSHINLQLTPIPKKNHNIKDKYYHFKDDYTACLVSYGLTSPIVQGGTLTCHLNRGTKVYEEKISFSVQRVKPQVVDEETIDVPTNGVVRLQCPKDESMLITMHIWYNNEPSPEDEIPFVVPTLDHEIVYKPKRKEEKVSCATYDLTNPTLVRITRYKLHLKDEDIKPGKWVVENPENDSQNQKASPRKGIYIAVGIILVGVCVALILGAASFGLCKLRKRRPPPTDEPKKEPNALCLLPSANPYDNKRLPNLYQ